MSNLFKRMSVTPVKLAVVIGAPLLVVAWHWAATLKEARLDKIAAELDSAVQFFGAPHPNHAGTKLFYAETSAEGIKAYMVDIASGQTTFLFEHEQSHLQGVGLLGWSPDDKVFAYSIRSPHGEVVVCDAKSTKSLGVIPENKIVEDGVWLSSGTLVYVNNNQDFNLVQKTDDGWHKSNLFAWKSSGDPRRGRRAAKVQCLTALSENSVAWQQGGILWRYVLGSDAPEKVWEAKNDILLNFCYSSQRSVFELNCRNPAGEFLLDVYPKFIWGDERLIGPQPIRPMSNPAETTIKTLAFFQDGTGYAYLAHSPTLDSVVVKADSNSAPVQLSWDGGADDFAASAGQVFAIGSPTNGPLGIWAYDVKARALNCVVPGTEHPFEYAKVVSATHAVATNDNGGIVTYYLSPPVDFVAGRKYPLVIGFTGHRWRSQEAAVGNAGCFLASCEGIPHDARDVLAVYQAVIRNPDVDKNRIYLMGISGGANFSAQMLEGSPELWRGAVLLSLVYVPDASRLEAARILIDSGGNDTYLKESGGVDKLTQFQNAAALAGIPVTLAVHPQASHVYRSTIAESGRIKEILKFLTDD
jgi:dipeptidyl aminopeptidase/acylaminoacyl peptidase